MHDEGVFILLFVVATAVAIASRRLQIPYTVALVLAGLALGTLQILEAPHLTEDLLFAVFLPGLLFEAAFHVDAAEFRRNRLAVVALAAPGVVTAILLTAALLVPVADRLDFVEDFDWRTALVFGALIAATDPIAVVGLFKSLGAPRRLTLLIEGESLLNDGTAIVLFTLVVGLVAGRTTSAADLAGGFVTVVGVGVVLGLAIGLAVAQVIRRVDDPMIEITLTTIAAYGSFLAAEHAGGSGVIATVAAGMVSGNYAARTGMSPSTRIAVESFWEYVAFALNSLVFLLIGFEVHVHALLASWPAILVAYAAVLLSRAAVITAVSGLLRRTRERIPARWSVVLVWGGLRGSLSMVLALGLPPTFPHRDFVVSVTFGVVILSILLQGVSMAPLLRWLGIVRGHALLAAHELNRGALQGARAALEEIGQIERAGGTPGDVLANLRLHYEQRVDAARARIHELQIDRADLRREDQRWIARHLLMIEKQTTIDAYRRGTLGQDAYERLLADVDARLLRLESGEDPDQGPITLE